MRVTEPPYTAPEELAHALTAGLGIVACVFAIPWLAWATAGDLPRLVGALAFGASALAMFVTSVVYHRERDLARKVTLRKLDHAAIYLLIAGTYTPFTLLTMRNPWGWVLFGVVWTLAIAGIAAKLTVGLRYPRLSTFMYLGMGWLIVIAINPLRESLSTTAARVDCRRRPAVHGRRAVLCLEIAPLHARRVAPVRARRRGLSLRRGAERGRRPRRLKRYFLRRAPPVRDFLALAILAFFAGLGLRAFLPGWLAACGLLLHRLGLGRLGSGRLGLDRGPGAHRRLRCWLLHGHRPHSCAGFAAAQLLDDRRVLESRQVLRDVFVARDGPQQAAHDLAGARLGQVVGEPDVVGTRDGA